MKTFFAIVAACASLCAGVGTNTNSQANTPALESLIARNEVQFRIGVEGHDLVLHKEIKDRDVREFIIKLYRN